MPRLAHVADSEAVSLTEDGKKALISLSGGDMRKVRNIMFYWVTLKFYNWQKCEVICQKLDI